MKQLNRAAVAPPGVLVNYSHPANTWDDVSTPDKAEIRTALEQMQGRRCAYCEGSIDELGQHIEHFRRKRVFPHLTFAWDNLLWCCDARDSCGHYKDRKGWPYDINHLLNPCIHDPDNFFRFRTDGSISIRRGLNQQELRMAQETLRVLNIDPEWGRLRQMRKRAVSTFLTLLDDLNGFTETELQQLLQDELIQARGLPFYTVVRHALTRA
ncbi:MAG: retron Ec78 anti-phage system effector HNH endonuclease PtuB [Bacteriovoracia bacterium]